MLIRAAIVRGLLVAGAGAIERGSWSEEVRLPARLQDLAWSFDGWFGAPAARFDDRTLTILGVDEYVHRVYYNSKRHPVSLYVGYYGSQREGDTMHSPLNCLPGSGWQPVSRGRARLDVPAASGRNRPVEVNELLIEKGAEKQVVLYWYQSRGRVTASEYWSKALTVRDAIRYNRTDGAIVRVVSPVIRDTAGASREAVEFVRRLFPRLDERLPR